MPARAPRRKATKTRRPQPKKARLIVSPMLTSREIRQRLSRFLTGPDVGQPLAQSRREPALC